jgi:hypothetical protein
MKSKVAKADHVTTAVLVKILMILNGIKTSPLLSCSIFKITAGLDKQIIR